MSRGRFPEGVPQPVHYGPRVKAVLIYLHSYQLLPYARTCELFRDLFGVLISEGTLFEAIQTGSASLEQTEGAIRKALTPAKVVHFDETGLRIEGRLHCCTRLRRRRSSMTRLRRNADGESEARGRSP